MAKLLEFNKKEENDLYVVYDIKSDGFDGNLFINKVEKIFEITIKSKYDFMTDEEMKIDEEDKLNFVVNKRTNGLTVFPDVFNYNS